MKGRSRTRWTWTVIAVAVTLVFVAGCSKKQTVKSTDTSPAQAQAAPALPPEKPITSETVAPPAASAPTQTAKLAPEAGVVATQEMASHFSDIHFDFDKAVIREDAKPVLAGIAEYIKENPGTRLMIEGHCDERGTAEYNMALGDKRAENVSRYLAALGVPAGVLSPVSFGKEKPVDQGHDEGAWAKNRRAHFVRK